MNDREWVQFNSAWEWHLAGEIERELSRGELPAFTEKMPVDDTEKRSRAKSLIELLRTQCIRWDGLVHGK